MVVIALTAIACDSEADPDRRADASPSPPEAAALVTELPTDCDGFGEAPSDGAITFTVEERLYEVSPDGATVTCLLPASGASPGQSWGGEADRVLLGGSLALGPDFKVTLPESVSTHWSRPTGKALIYISKDHAQLLKIDAGSTKERDITFLAEHHDVAYHPAGTHIVTSGYNAGGIYGIFLADNEGGEGGDIHMIARGESATWIDGLTFSHDGMRLYFSADHGDEFHLHELVMERGRGAEGQVTREVALKTLATGPEPFETISVSEFTSGMSAGYVEKPERMVAYSQRCRLSTFGEFAPPIAAELQGSNAQPVGWLPDGTLIALGYDDGCNAPSGELLRILPEGDAILIAEGVEAAAVRAVLPPPPKPPEPPEGVVA